MQVTHSGVTYECNVAVKCETDKYIKLYDANGVEIVSFNHISDFSDYTISGGSFIPPSNCNVPIELTTYVIGGRTIAPGDWKSTNGKYAYTISNDLISANSTTCDILLNFAKDTQLTYQATQANGEITLSVDMKPTTNIVIDSIIITRI